MSDPPQGPLAGLRALDLAGEPGLFAGRMLAELGAEVIRVEPPGGDAVRRRPPFLDGSDPPISLYHLHFNAGKRGLTLDIRHPDGAALLRRLAAVSDIWIDSAAPGEMDALGLGYAGLAVAQPGLVYATITPFGQEGPLRDYRANDLIGAAMSGLMYLNGMPEDPPNVPGAEQAYHMAALAAVSAALVAIAGRERDPGRRGRRIDVSIQEAASMATLQTANANIYAWHHRIPARTGMSALGGGRALFACRDGKWISFTIPVGPGPFFGFFLDWLAEAGVAHALSEAWLDPSYRTQHSAPVMDAIAALCAKHDREALFHEGQRRRLLVMPVNDVADLVHDRQLRARDYFAAVAHPTLGRTLELPGAAYHFSATAAGIRTPAPAAGEHTDELLETLRGVDRAERDRLRREGVL
ncbi:MAG: CoA transferase [Dehalococcoidia bacterium]